MTNDLNFILTFNMIKKYYINIKLMIPHKYIVCLFVFLFIFFLLTIFARFLIPSREHFSLSSDHKINEDNYIKPEFVYEKTVHTANSINIDEISDLKNWIEFKKFSSLLFSEVNNIN